MLRLKPQRPSSIIIIIIIVILAASYYLGLSGLTGRYITVLTNPVIGRANYTASAIGDFLAVYLGRADLNKKNNDLSRKIIELSKKNIELKLLRQENEYLRKELEFTAHSDFKFVIARIIGSGPDYHGTDLIIDQGLSAGIKKGLPITTKQGVIIGKIENVKENTARLKLLTDNRSKLSVIVASRESSLGVLHGEHNLSLKIEMLPKQSSIAAADLVTTSGLDQYVPAGLLIGNISKIDTSREKLWQEAIVEPAVDYNQVRLVTVILSDSD